MAQKQCFTAKVLCWMLTLAQHVQLIVLEEKRVHCTVSKALSTSQRFVKVQTHLMVVTRCQEC